MKKILLRAGLIDGLPIAMGYFAVSFSFGIAAVAAGIAPIEALLISMTNLTEGFRDMSPILSKRKIANN